MNENLFSRRFWIGDADARLFALYRVILGATLLYDAADRLADFHSFYTERGLLPQAVAVTVRTQFSWSLFDMIQPWGLELALYLLGMGALISFIVGYRTRVAGFASWLFLVSIQHRNDLVLDGSDIVVRVMLFWMLFADSGACFSLDVRLGRRAARALVPAHPLGFLRVQLALVYLFTAVDKWHGGWWDHNYLYQVMQSFDFVRWAGPSLLRLPRLCAILTRGTIVVELLIPLLWLSPVFIRPTRALGLLLNLSLHIGIFSTLAVGNFPGVMIGASTVFLLPEWLDLFLPRVRSEANPPRAPRKLGLLVGGVLLVAVIASVAGYSFRLRFRQRFNEGLDLIGLQQSWPMFATGLQRQGRWFGKGTLVDGTEIDVFARVAPGLMTTGAGARYSRWYKLRFGLSLQSGFTLFDSISRYLCRVYNGRTSGPLLREVDMQYWDHRVAGFGESVPEPVRYDVYHTRCGETPVEEVDHRRPSGPFVTPPAP